MSDNTTKNVPTTSTELGTSSGVAPTNNHGLRSKNSDLSQIIKHDDEVLASFGYQQQMNRRFSRISLLAMGFCILK